MDLPAVAALTALGLNGSFSLSKAVRGLLARPLAVAAVFSRVRERGSAVRAHSPTDCLSRERPCGHCSSPKNGEVFRTPVVQRYIAPATPHALAVSMHPSRHHGSVNMIPPDIPACVASDSRTIARNDEVRTVWELSRVYRDLAPVRFASARCVCSVSIASALSVYDVLSDDYPRRMPG